MRSIFWSGRKIVFTGKLNSMTHEKAVNILKEQGAIITNSISKQMNDLILGDLRHTSRKLTVAKGLIKNGHDITILSEDEFLKMLYPKLSTQYMNTIMF